MEKEAQKFLADARIRGNDSVVAFAARLLSIECASVADACDAVAQIVLKEPWYTASHGLPHAFPDGDVEWSGSPLPMAACVAAAVLRRRYGARVNLYAV